MIASLAFLAGAGGGTERKGPRGRKTSSAGGDYRGMVRLQMRYAAIGNVDGTNDDHRTIPKFTAPAAKRWEAISADTRKMLLSNVWCAKCRHAATITNFSGAVKAGDLLLVGKCAECQGDVARLIES